MFQSPSLFGADEVAGKERFLQEASPTPPSRRPAALCVSQTHATSWSPPAYDALRAEVDALKHKVSTLARQKQAAAAAAAARAAAVDDDAETAVSAQPPPLARAAVAPEYYEAGPDEEQAAEIAPMVPAGYQLYAPEQGPGPAAPPPGFQTAYPAAGGGYAVRAVAPAGLQALAPYYAEVGADAAAAGPPPPLPLPTYFSEGPSGAPQVATGAQLAAAVSPYEFGAVPGPYPGRPAAGGAGQAYPGQGVAAPLAGETISYGGIGPVAARPPASAAPVYSGDGTLYYPFMTAGGAAVAAAEPVTVPAAAAAYGGRVRWKREERTAARHPARRPDPLPPPAVRCPSRWAHRP